MSPGTRPIRTLFLWNDFFNGMKMKIILNKQNLLKTDMPYFFFFFEKQNRHAKNIVFKKYIIFVKRFQLS